MIVYQCLSVIFLSDRYFKGNIYSDPYSQEKGSIFLSRYLVSRLIVLYLAFCLILNVPFMLMIWPFITVLVICHLSRESYNILSTD